MQRSLVIFITLFALSGCATWNARTGKEPFTPQPVLSPPGSDIDSIGGVYAVPPAPKPTPTPAPTH